MDEPPEWLVGSDVYDWVMQLPEVIFGSQVNTQRIPGFGKEHNWVKRSIFWELPYQKDLQVRHHLDVMYTVKIFHDNIFYTGLDDKVRTKDNVNVHCDMEKLCT